MILKCFKYNQHFVAMMNIINLARIRNINGNFERHHIIPRCFFKYTGQKIDNSENNVVNLTSEEHVKVHLLASMCAEKIIEQAMKNAANIIVHKRDMVNNNPMSESKYRKKISDKLKGRNFSNLHKRNLSAASAKRTDRRSGFSEWFRKTFNTTREENYALYKREYVKWRKSYASE